MNSLTKPIIGVLVSFVALVASINHLASTGVPTNDNLAVWSVVFVVALTAGCVLVKSGIEYWEALPE